jgi:ribosomal protein L3 glutamine methyltransferase
MSLNVDHTSLKTVIDWLRYGATCMAQSEGLAFGHGCDNAWDEAHALILGVLSLPYDMCIATYGHACLLPSEQEALVAALHRRCVQREPVAYIVGRTLLDGYVFFVNQQVLIPRSPLFNIIKQHYQPWLTHDIHHVLDLCSGSGCLAILQKIAMPDVLVDATDISMEALKILKKNVAYHDVAIDSYHGDLWEALPHGKQYDVIISNPPYVASVHYRALPPEYHHEPYHALVADDHGLAIIHRIMLEHSRYLKPNGLLLLEVGNAMPDVLRCYHTLPWVQLPNGILLLQHLPI